MVRFLPVLLLVLLLIVIFNITPVKQTIAYRLNLSNDPTTSCCNADDVLNSKGDFDESAAVAIFEGEEVNYPKTSLASNFKTKIPDTQVLGTTNEAGVERWIEVSLDDQLLRAWEGNQLVMEFPISSGKWSATPKGSYEIWYKTRSQTMKGGSKELGTYYYLPNVPHNMFFHKGYAIHGAYWHNNFGHPMSHGCVNAPLDQVGQLFSWAGPVVPEGQNYVKSSPENPGTRVWVH